MYNLKNFDKSIQSRKDHYNHMELCITPSKFTQVAGLPLATTNLFVSL